MPLVIYLPITAGKGRGCGWVHAVSMHGHACSHSLLVVWPESESGEDVSSFESHRRLIVTRTSVSVQALERKFVSDHLVWLVGWFVIRSRFLCPGVTLCG